MRPPSVTQRLRTLWSTVWFRAAVGVVVVGLAFVFGLPRFAPYGQVVDQLTAIDGRWMTALAVLGVINLIAPVLSFRAALPGLRFGDGLAMDWATTAVTNVVPAGSAVAIGLTWTMLRSFGLGGRAITRAIVVTGVWDAFVKLGTPLMAIAWLAASQPIDGPLIQAAVFGAVLFVVAVVLGTVVMTGPGTAQGVGRLLDRLPIVGLGWPARLDEMRTDTVAMLSSRWRSLTWWTVFGHANLYLLLVICLGAVGVERSDLGPAQVLAGFAFGRLITAVPITPGGLGVMELGLVGALGAVGTAPDAAVVAAVLLFRFLNFAVPIPLGVLSWLWWRNVSRQRPVTTAEIPSQV